MTELFNTCEYCDKPCEQDAKDMDVNNNFQAYSQWLEYFKERCKGE